MSKRDHILLIQDILESANRIKKYTQGMDLKSFLEDEKTIDAVVRNFEIIGEAANRMDDEFKSMHDDVDWNKLRGFRNRIIHEYFGIDHEIVWNIVDNELNVLTAALKDIANPE